MILWGADGREEEAEKEEEEEEEEGSWTQVVGEQTGFWEEVTCNSFRKGVLQLSLCTHTHTHTHTTQIFMEKVVIVWWQWYRGLDGGWGSNLGFWNVVIDSTQQCNNRRTRGVCAVF